MTLTQNYTIEGTDYYGTAFTLELIDRDRPGYISLTIATEKVSLTIEEWERVVTVVQTAQIPLASGATPRRDDSTSERSPLGERGLSARG